jgi:Putative Flp pilus-assembly TadE/G-like
MMSLSRRKGMKVNEKGAVLPLFALAMLTMLGMMGLALDFGNFYLQKRHMQSAADAGALAGAAEIYRNRMGSVTGSALSATASNGFTHGSDGVAVTVNRPPANGYYVGNPQFVEVLISRNYPSFILKVFGLASATVPARAVAGAGAKSPNCVLVLHPTEEKALTVTSGSQLIAPNCNVYDNSRADDAFNVESMSIVNSGGNFVTGGTNITSGSWAAPEVVTDAPPIPDPLASMPKPTVGACNHNDFKVSSGTFTLNPGVYCNGIEIASGATATFNPGMYIIKDKGLKIASGSTVSGAGVTFFNTGTDDYSPISIESGSSADFAAPTTGTWANILFFQDPAVGDPGTEYMNLIQSSIKAKFKGVMYFPTQILALATSNSTVDLEGAIVANTLMIESGSIVSINYSFPGNSPLKRITLVE